MSNNMLRVAEALVGGRVGESTTKVSSDVGAAYPSVVSTHLFLSNTNLRHLSQLLDVRRRDWAAAAATAAVPDHNSSRLCP